MTFKSADRYERLSSKSDATLPSMQSPLAVESSPKMSSSTGGGTNSQRSELQVGEPTQSSKKQQKTALDARLMAVYFS